MGTVSALFLCGVLVVAGVAKLRDQPGTVAGFSDLGLPRPKLLGWLVPVMELAVAVLLVALPGWGGVAAFGLLVFFTAVLVVTIRAGRPVPCRCFGGSDDAPVSWGQVARNVWLLCLALVASTVTTLSWPNLQGFVIAAALIAIGPIAIGMAERRFTVGP